MLSLFHIKGEVNLMGTKRPDQFHRDLGEPGADSNDRGPDPAIHDEARQRLAEQGAAAEATSKIPESHENPALRRERQRKAQRAQSSNASSSATRQADREREDES
jgi:hypothetical protein